MQAAILASHNYTATVETVPHVLFSHFVSLIILQTCSPDCLNFKELKN